MVMLLLFSGLLIFSLTHERTSDPDAYVIPIFFLSILLYFINDMAGLSLIKRIRRTRDISQQVMTRLSVTIFIQFILQLFLAYGVISFIRLAYYSPYYSASLFTRANMLPATMTITIFIIFFSSCVNMYATIRLMKIAKQNHNELKEMVDGLGSDTSATISG
jgi:hypothetical protein